MDGPVGTFPQDRWILRGVQVEVMRKFVLIAAVALAALGGDLPKVVNDGYGDYLLVPAGSFKMGDNFGDGESRERPVHVVDLDAYYIGKFEITNGEWRKFRDDA